MRKLIFTLAAMATVASLIASDLPKLTLAISTQGPDTYEDGTVVVAGETYLLVNVADPNQEFAGVRMDGTLINPSDKIATFSLAGEGGYCQFKAVVYNVEDFPVNSGWLLVLLDTRNSAGVPVLLDDGGIVAGYSPQSQGVTVKVDENQAAQDLGKGSMVQSSLVSYLPLGAKKPAISELSLDEGSADLTITDIIGTANYNVEASSDLSNWEKVAEKLTAADHGEAGGKEIKTRANTGNDGARFFRVVIPAR